jgi:hypothetical protein
LIFRIDEHLARVANFDDFAVQYKRGAVATRAACTLWGPVIDCSFRVERFFNHTG